LILVGLFGLLGLSVYAAQYSGLQHVSVAGVGIVVAGAALLIGGLLGFLFGIPHTLPPEHRRPPNGDGNQGTAKPKSPGTAEPSYLPNTNLEQISDWLTKILVGVGLTELSSIPSKMKRLGDYLAPGLGGASDSSTFALGLSMYFVVCGFLIGFLWTRLCLQRAMRESDVAAEAVTKAENAEKNSDQALAELRKQEACRKADDEAWALVNRQLSLGPGLPSVSEEELNEKINMATGPTRARIYYDAARVRSNNWSDNKPLMERTIPIFKALIASDSENRYPENHGQLGFALKDKGDFKGALDQLEIAISMRRQLQKSEGQAWSEFLRAVCRINLDGKFNQVPKQPSDDETKRLILEDLRTAQDTGLSEAIRREVTACDWIRLNKLEKELPLST
jgi:hypothetical protein